VHRVVKYFKPYCFLLVAVAVMFSHSLFAQAADVNDEHGTINSANLGSESTSNKLLVTETLRDPTQPLHFRQGKKSALPSLTLQAVIQRNGKSQAVINGVVVGVGSRLGTATILAIEAKSVTYERGGKVASLRLRPSVVTKR